MEAPEGLPNNSITEDRAPSEYVELQALAKRLARAQGEQNEAMAWRHRACRRAGRLGSVPVLPSPGGRLLGEIGSLL